MKHRVNLVLVVREERFLYYRPSDDDCFASVLKGHPESFLSVTERSPADVLVVEGWIGREGVRAAGEEFKQRGYQYVVATGGLTANEGCQEAGRSYAEQSENELTRSGVPEDRIIVAAARDSEAHRTFESAIPVWRALRAKGLQAKSLNVLRSVPMLGGVAWFFPGTRNPARKRAHQLRAGQPLRYTSVTIERTAKEMITKIAGFVFEVPLNSGRETNSQPIQTDFKYSMFSQDSWLPTTERSGQESQ